MCGLAYITVFMLEEIYPRTYTGARMVAEAPPWGHVLVCLDPPLNFAIPGEAGLLAQCELTLLILGGF